MPDIKIKPQMDKPKVRVANNTPKDAGSILKQEYMSQQREKQPDQKGPVQYATDRVETTGRRGTMATADGMRRIAGRARNKRKGQSADTKQENHLSETVLQEPGAAPKTGAQPNAERRAQTQYIQERREQLQADKTHSHSAKHFEFDRDAVYYPDNPSSRPYRFNQSPVQPANLTPGQETPAQNVAASPQEQGRHKVIADAKATRRKARNLTEKETARHSAVRSAGTKPEGRQFINEAHYQDS